MFWIALILLIGLLVSNIGWMYVHQHGEEMWRLERQELLNRITHPEFIPTPTLSEPVDLGEPEPDEIGVVGTVQLPGMRRDD